jgi:hypothetical protein
MLGGNHIRGCIASRGPFEEVAGEQLAATVDQLLLAYNVQDPEVWVPIITRLADEAAGMLSPAKAVAFGNLDPRFYVKVCARGSIPLPSPSHVKGSAKVRLTVQVEKELNVASTRQAP